MCKVVNNCNVLAMGAKVISEFRAKNAVDLWLNKEFTEGNSEEGKKLLNKGFSELVKIETANMK